MRLSSLFSKEIVSIDIGSYETKVVEGKVSNSNIEIGKYFSFLTPKGTYKKGYILNEKLLANTIKEELSKHKIKANNTYISIKSPSIFTREIKLPNVGKEEIDGILKYQLDEYLPIDIEEYVVQYRTMGKIYENSLEKNNLLLIAIPKKIVEDNLNLLETLDLKPRVLDFQSNGVTKFIGYNSIINNKIDTEAKTFALLDLGFENTNVTISKNSQLQVARIIEIGGDYLNNNILNFFDYNEEQLEKEKKDIKYINIIDEEYTKENRLANIVSTSIEEIMKRIDTIFKYYTSREIGNEIHTIVLYGGLSNIKGVDKLFENYYSIPTIKLKCADRIFFAEDMSKYINCISSLIRNEGN